MNEARREQLLAFKNAKKRVPHTVVIHGRRLHAVTKVQISISGGQTRDFDVTSLNKVGILILRFRTVVKPAGQGAGSRARDQSQHNSAKGDTLSALLNACYDFVLQESDKTNGS